MEAQWSMCILLLLGVATTAMADTVQYPQDWHIWKAKHGVSYEDDIEELRRHITWLSNKAYIDNHNQYADTFGYTLKMNHLGDLTSREFVEEYMCVRQHRPQNISQLNSKYAHRFKQYHPLTSSLPEEMDWRTSGAVTSIKDQLRCSCSYAFAATGALEGACALSGESLVSLSAQNIVDCSVPFGNHGCSCGDIYSAYMYIIDNDGVNTWSSYGYRSKQMACRYSAGNRGATMTGVVTISSGDEHSLQSAVANVGPVSTYIDASHSSFQFYSEGILDIPNCSRSKLTHALLVIGYGYSHSKDYWLVKNSWGPNWGIYGYAKLARNKSNQCGIATSASFPTL